MLRRFPAVLCGRISGCQWFRQIGFGCQSSCGDFARPVSGGLPPCGGFRRSIVLLRFPPARFCRPVSGCQLSCGGFCTGFLVADRLCSDFCSSGFRLSTVLRWVPHRILVADCLFGDFRRPILAAWLPGPAVSLLPDPCGRCGSDALAAAACGSRFSGCRAPEFRPRIFRRLPQKMLSH